MPTFSRASFFSTCLCLLAHPLFAQQNHAADRLLAARALYYTPTANGLKSFECKITFDWKDYLTRFGGQTITDDNPALVYLKATQMSVTDALTGQGTLNWVNTEDMPEGKQGAFKQIRDGMVQVFTGFFQSWNGYMNGSMVPAPDKTVSVAPNGDGFQLRDVTGKNGLLETFDKNMLLSAVHVTTPAMDVEAFPTYATSPDGLIITTVRSLVKQPPTAQPMEVTFTTTYAKVGEYQIPATVEYNVKNVADLHFTFSACEVKTAESSPMKP